MHPLLAPLRIAPSMMARIRIAPSMMARITVEPVPQRAETVAAAETVALVLDEGTPLPETNSDVEDLALRLRGHVNQLGVIVAMEEPALLRAQQLASAEVPDGYMPSRVHLAQLAEATRELVAAVKARTECAERQQGCRRWTPGINMLRGSVFVVALACLILAASVPRP
ncbi:DUF6415 family natural product biosynthesis protein [Streptomyces sp. NPDC102384]|uniref:DUF6415 family natural product biosynthesis protein n=1 Tax=Streptomyces sp. NPDC102384 TaxID=3366166 RepID=UPI00381C6FD2